MTDDIYPPPSKPTTHPGGPPAFPPTKAQATDAAHQPSCSSPCLAAAFSLPSSSSLLSPVAISIPFTAYLDLNITSCNSNKKLVYHYDPIAFSNLFGALQPRRQTLPYVRPGHGERDPSLCVGFHLQSSIGQCDDVRLAVELRWVEVETGVNIGGLKTKQIDMKVLCEGLSVTLPAGKKAGVASPRDDCTVKLRLKIWKWQRQLH
ncbi:uncharacterized protein LOC122003880 [Zingiber officinale]|nr:uncharacterized protein LOC122003880 [Zingiber officinale]